MGMMETARDRNTVRRAIRISLIVGTVLTFINQYDAPMGQEPFKLIPALLTYVVPFCISTYSTCLTLRQLTGTSTLNQPHR